MTKRERVMAALRGAPVDRVPLAFWLHNFATENSAKGLAEETLRVQFDGWMRMAMEEWRKSRREGLGRATFLTTAMRLASTKTLRPRSVD